MIRKYTDMDFDTLNGWIKDAEILFRFSGPDWNFPLTREQLNSYISKHPQRQFYTGIDDEGGVFAFGEIITGDAYSPRLGRLIVGEENKRGKGLGQMFVKDLMAECFQLHDSRVVFLFVFEDNEPAINCYKKCGFDFCEGGHMRRDVHGNSLNVLKMQALK